MITTKLIIQSVLGVGAIAGVVGGGYMMIGTSEEYFLVTSVSEVTSSNVPDLELWTKPVSTKTVSEPTSGQTSLASGTQAPSAETTEKESDKTQKNYQCQITTKKDHFDKDCELISIDFHATNKTAYLSTELANIKNSKKPKKAELALKKFFLLRVTGSKYDELMKSTEANKTIELLSNKKADSESYKSYAKLTVHAKVSNDSVKGQTDWAIVKAKTVTATTTVATITTPTYKCKFQNETDTNAKSCVVQEITQPTNDKKLENLNLSTLTDPVTPTTSLTTVVDKYYAIKWTDKIDISKLKNNVVVFYEETTAEGANNKKTSEFTVESFAFANINTGNNSFFILK